MTVGAGNLGFRPMGEADGLVGMLGHILLRSMATLAISTPRGDRILAHLMLVCRAAMRIMTGGATQYLLAVAVFC